ncbi:L-threonylcarbamoyladenylate synthase [Noviherbaspirillum pedocola]|uniref:Threonylcarbamoyl-AMP synthase n=1 Tax=Noviherbaspirillum pedocola TaxID=2801341 RepID=A0A934SQ87_9BURK|nr:L-threonylcarbamoyladenylate synthase [Noviherbaspirillum pedocola]MBK4733308.1 threonylcarbamoyl-AMP synthase [Noviherbaspirillum pedocola]
MTEASHTPDAAAISAAARLLEAGELVAFPTETVYGLGADAESPEAVARIFAAKGRPSNHPVIVHLAPGADIGRWAIDVPPEAHRLIAAFWPGPLTLILKRAPAIPAAVSGGQDSIGLRCPSHPVAQALLAEFKGGQGGVAAPSANRFGHVSPTTAAHVRGEFGDGPDSPLAMVLDGGQSEVGIESTIVDLSRMANHGPALLRPGHISAEQIAAVIGQWPGLGGADAPRVSGALDSHYAPATPVVLVDGAELASVLDSLRQKGRRVALIACGSDAPAPVGTVLPREPAGYAHGLYAALRDMDAAGAEVILVERPPQDDAWLGINDRLRRSAFGSEGVLGRLLG